MKILILKPSSLGDVVQALPVLRMLKRHWPTSRVYWWLDVDLSALLESDPDLEGCLLFPRRRWARPWLWSEVLVSLRQIRKMAFDVVIDLQALARSGLLTWFSGAGLTVGLDDTREGASALYDVRVPRPSWDTHAVDWYLEVLKVLRVPRSWDFTWLPDRPAVTETIRREWPVEGATWVTLHPGARWLNKRWPPEYFVDLIRRMGRAFPHVRVAILGGAGDGALGRMLAAAAPNRCLDLTGRTSLPEMIEWIRLSRLLVSNDSGPMHIAAALGKPVVAVFGPTTPYRTGPYGRLAQVVQAQLDCVPCLKSRCTHVEPLACLRAVSPEAVLAQVADRLPGNLSQ